MEKGYEIFIEKLRQALLRATGFEKERIYFKEKDAFPRTSGDRLFLECRVKEDSSEVCGLYIQELYERYINGTALEQMTAEVMQELHRMQDAGFLKKAADMDDYEKIKGDLFIRLLNSERNKKDLENAIYKVIGDIALVLYIKMGEVDNCITSAKIKEDVLEKWEGDREQIFQDALLNTYFLSPPRIYCWEKLLFNEAYEGDNFMDLMSKPDIKRDSMGNCLSTTKRTNGAVAIFLPGVAARMAELIGGDFYMVFTSIHEVMIHNVDFVEPCELRRVLEETIREATPEEDFLSFFIYRYNKDSAGFSYE